MPAFSPDYWSLLPLLLAPTAAIAFMVGGAALISSGMRVRRRLVARRVDLIRNPVAVARLESEERPSRLQGLHIQHLSRAQRQEGSRLFFRTSRSPSRALVQFTIVRLGIAACLGVLGMFWFARLDAFAALPLAEEVFAVAGTVLGWYLPAMFLSYRLRQRAKLISGGLPDALELLVVCVEAGLSLEDGLERVVRELAHSQPALAEELALTSADLKVLQSRDEALARLAERVDMPNVRSVVATLSQSLRYGTPLARSLRSLAAEVRNDFLLQLEERANRLPALLTFPVILFIMPTMFLILGGPAALALMDMFWR